MKQVFSRSQDGIHTENNKQIENVERHENLMPKLT